MNNLENVEANDKCIVGKLVTFQKMDTDRILRFNKFAELTNSIIERFNQSVECTRTNLSKIENIIGDKDSGLVKKINTLREDVNSLTEDPDIPNPNTFFSPELNPLG